MLPTLFMPSGPLRFRECEIPEAQLPGMPILGDLVHKGRKEQRLPPSKHKLLGHLQKTVQIAHPLVHTTC
jgi:hypothetical protein